MLSVLEMLMYVMKLKTQANSLCNVGVRRTKKKDQTDTAPNSSTRFVFFFRWLSSTRHTKISQFICAQSVQRTVVCFRRESHAKTHIERSSRELNETEPERNTIK